VKVLALADRPPICAVEELAVDNHVDVVLCAGDLDTAWIQGLVDVAVPKLGVYGNHDDEQYAPLGVDDLHLRTVTVAGTRFAGFEGCVRYKPGPHQYTQEEAERLVEELPECDILLCHCPPYGVNDDPKDPAHIGFHALRAYVDRVHPSWLVHGHTHPQPGRIVRKVGTTRVVHVQGARVLDFG
jgi:uncharacterized protein